MAKTTVKCFYCKQEVEKECAISIERKNFHKECLDDYLLKQKESLDESEKKKADALEARYKKKYTCPMCNCAVQEDDDDKKLHVGVFYHSECYIEKTTNAAERRQFTDFIDLKLKEQGSSFGEHLELVKRMKELMSEPFNYTYKRIRYVLEYILETQENYDAVNCFKGMVKLVPDFEKDAIRSYYKNKEQQESVDELVSNNIPFVTQVTITIRPPKIERIPILELVDIASIGKDEGDE